MTEEALIAHCAERLAAYKVPRAVRWWDTLPRNAAGKLLRRVLRNSYFVGACTGSHRRSGAPCASRT